MQCPGCQVDNPPGFRFCGGCGGSLPLACVACGEPVPASFRFCGRCGSPAHGTAAPPPQGLAAPSPPPALAARPAMASPARRGPDAAGARRTVAALVATFTERVGGRSITPSLDPDFAACISQVGDLVRRAGGRVERADAATVLTLFGTGVPRPDDTLRAVRTALAAQAIARNLGRARAARGLGPLSLRTAVQAGEVMTSPASPGGIDAAGLKDVLRQAAQLSASLATGRVWAGERAFAAAGGGLEGHEVTVEGAGPLVRAFQVTGLSRWRSAGAPARLVGRASQIQALRSALTRVLQEQRPRAITIVGPPGVGKRRLVAELHQGLGALPQEVCLVSAECPPLGAGTVLGPLAQILTGLADIAPTDVAAVVGGKLSALVDRACFPRGRVGWAATVAATMTQRLGESLGLPVGVGPLAEVEDRSVAQEVFWSYARLLGGLSSGRALVVVVEDLQWADQLLLDALRSIREWIVEGPILFIHTATDELLATSAGFAPAAGSVRPEAGRSAAGTALWSGLVREERHSLLEVAGLPPEEAGGLLEELGLAGQPQGMRDEIVQKARGSPLYMIHAVETLAAEGLLAWEEPGPGTSSGGAPAGPGGGPPSIPGFEILGELGRGGMGIVYRARQVSLDRVVAIKVLPPDLSSNATLVERFDREARVLAKLDHPHVVKVIDRGLVGGTWYFAMEFIEGESLSSRLRLSPIDTREALRILVQVADALQYAHDRGVVHRDVKPDNVLIDPQGNARVSDFGLAGILVTGGVDRATAAQMALGTPFYMAPEQAMNARDVDARADVYSLGVILYELLTGALPTGLFEPPSRLREGIDPRLDEIVRTCLAQDRERRYPTARAFREALEAVLSSIAGDVATTSQVAREPTQAAASPAPKECAVAHEVTVAPAAAPLTATPEAPGTILLDLPADIPSLVARHLATLAPEERQALEVVALCGPRSDPAALAFILGLADAAEAEGRLSGLARSGLVGQPRQGAPYRPTHPVVAQVAVSGFEPALLARRRARLAQWLELAWSHRPGIMLEEAAHHLSGSLDWLASAQTMGEGPRSERVAEVLVEAGERLGALGALARSREVLESARGIMDRPAPGGGPSSPALKDRATLALGRVLAESGAAQEAHDLLSTLAGRPAAQGATGAHGRALALLSRIHQRRGDRAGAQDLARQAVGALRGQGDEPARAAALLRLAGILDGTHHRDEIARILDEARDAFRQLQSIPGEAAVMRATVALVLSTGGLAQARKLSQEALVVLGKVHDLRGELAASRVAARLHYFRGEFTDAESLSANAQRMSTELGDRAGQAESALWLARVGLAQGRLEEVGPHLEAARRQGSLAGADHLLVEAEVLEAELSALRGDLATATSRLAGAMERAGSHPDPRIAIEAGIVAGALALEQGDHDGAARSISAAAQRARAVGDTLWQVRAEMAMVPVWMRRGQLLKALEALRAVSSLVSKEDAWAVATAERYSGALKAALGEAPRAREHYFKAMQIYKDRGFRIDGGIARAEWAAILLEQGQTADARSALEAARDLLTRSGARAELAKLEKIALPGQKGSGSASQP